MAFMSIRVDWCRFVWIGVDSCGLVSMVVRFLKMACTHVSFFKWGSLIPLKVHFRELRPYPSKLGKSTFVCTKVQLAIPKK